MKRSPCNGWLGLVLVIGASLVTLAAQAGEIPTFAQVRAQWRSSEALLLDRNGVVLQSQRIDHTQRRLQWVALEEVSPAFRSALLRSEDRRFHEHSGIDWQAVGGALADSARGAVTLSAKAPRGASTITMQLAGLLDDQPRAARRTLTQKVDQARIAWLIERRWTKAQILEAYVNLVGFRGELVGLAALSELMFGKDPASLSAQEGAIAAALIRAPAASAQRVAQRACLLLREGAAERDEAQHCAALPVLTEVAMKRQLPVSPHAAADASHLARKLLKVPGEQVRSTLDARVQRLAQETLQRQVQELVKRNVHDGAVIVLDNATGDVLAWVGSTGRHSDAAQVDAVLAPRQAGSTLKPFLYAQAIAERRLTAASLLEDSALNLPAGGGLYGPQNYDRGYKGTVSVRTALASSLNVPAVRTGVMVTPAAFAQTLRALGMRTVDQPGDHYGFSLALGSADVTLLDLANAYRALANQGRYSPVRTQFSGNALASRPAAPAVQVLDARAAFIVTDILADRNARALGFGWDSPLATRMWSAVKTGTSKDMRDNWCIGFSRRHTVAVWMGNAAGEPMWGVSGVSGAAPVWAEIMRGMSKTFPAETTAMSNARTIEPAVPPGLVRQMVQFDAGVEASRQEWFYAETVLARVQSARTERAPSIVEPVQGSLLALDPDIPPANQRVRFQAVSAGAGARWLVDGQEVARGEQAWWFPLPGRHVITLRDAAGREIDRVSLEVRGAVVKRARVRARTDAAS